MFAYTSLCNAYGSTHKDAQLLDCFLSWPTLLCWFFKSLQEFSRSYEIEKLPTGFLLRSAACYCRNLKSHHTTRLSAVWHSSSFKSTGCVWQQRVFVCLLSAYFSLLWGNLKTLEGASFCYSYHVAGGVSSSPLCVVNLIPPTKILFVTKYNTIRPPGAFQLGHMHRLDRSEFWQGTFEGLFV